MLTEQSIRLAIQDGINNSPYRGFVFPCGGGDKLLSFDTETYLIRPGQAAPKMVCGSFASYGRSGELYTDLQLPNESIEIVREHLEKGGHVVGQNVAFDMTVLCARAPHLTPLVFRAYTEGRVHCTKIRQQLCDIEAGTFRGRMGSDNVWIKYGYSLDELVPRLLGKRCEKDGFRLFYSLFDGVPIQQWGERAVDVQRIAAQYVDQPNGDSWGLVRFRALFEGLVKPKDIEGLLSADPSRATSYPIDDAVLTLELFEAQKDCLSESAYEDSLRQARFYFAIRLAEVWGMRTQLETVEIFAGQAEEEFSRIQDILIREKLVVPKNKKGEYSRDTKAAKARMEQVAKESGKELRLTPAGQTCLDEQACVDSEDPLLQLYAEYTTAAKVLSTDVELLRKGVKYPIHASFGLAATGRTTCSKPNLQNIRSYPGIRECFIPRPGSVFIQADYPGLELFTWAQCCVTLLGQSKLAEVLRLGEDPHMQLAATILGITYQEAKAGKAGPEVKKARALAKIANFGFPGGMGPDRLAAQCSVNAKSRELGIDAAKAKDLKSLWLATWPEAEHYFRYINSLKEEDNTYTVQHVGSGRVRAGASYTAACNSFFQGLGADATKAAVFAVQKECYAKEGSDLYGVRVVNYVHDEIIAECPEDRAHKAALRLADVMIDEANKWLPDVPIPRDRLEPLIMRYWSKDAVPTFNDRGELIPWG